MEVHEFAVKLGDPKRINALSTARVILVIARTVVEAVQKAMAYVSPADGEVLAVEITG